ncbi:hypothetical protein AB0O82_32745 [Kitasatospora sp. NPDC088264]|uniref:hypothetical protein n=1 Tax=Kitasatospora sp. NPDC088264 TaxID=3155296 RepID=UPI00344106F7
MARHTRPRPHPVTDRRPARLPRLPRRFGARHFLCTPCDTTWSGQEADCWSCGQPATTERPAPSSALQQLLAPVVAADTRLGHDRFRRFVPAARR